MARRFVVNKERVTATAVTATTGSGSTRDHRITVVVFVYATVVAVAWIVLLCIVVFTTGLHNFDSPMIIRSVATKVPLLSRTIANEWVGIFVSAKTLTTATKTTKAPSSSSSLHLTRTMTNINHTTNPEVVDAEDTELNSSSSSSPSLILTIVRHGQAQHNPRAEKAKSNGCSMDEFFRLMQEDDALDADLTELGRKQARQCHACYFAGSDGGDDANGEGQGDYERDSDDQKGGSNGLKHQSAEFPSKTMPSSASSLFDYVISSPLSRAIETADLVYPPMPSSSTTKLGVLSEQEQQTPGTPTTQASLRTRICVEQFREINGRLLNGKRRTKTELQCRFPQWDFTSLRTDHDDTWTEEMESYDDAADRGYRGLIWLLELSQQHPRQQKKHMKAPQDCDSYESRPLNVLLVSHGGLLRYTMNNHPCVHLADERKQQSEVLGVHEHKHVGSRFDNCEVRRYRLSWKSNDVTTDSASTCYINEDQIKRHVVLTQIDL